MRNSADAPPSKSLLLSHSLSKRSTINNFEAYHRDTRFGTFLPSIGVFASPTMLLPQYLYLRLRHDDSIRLIEFGRSTNSSRGEIQLQMREYRLCEAPSYYALSNAWRCPEPISMVEVIIDGRSLLVSKNCKAALDQLASTSSTYTQPFLLCIDAICIDQALPPRASAERDHQLQMMCDIYKCAQQTLLWPGPDTDNAALCLAYIGESEGVHRGEALWSQSAKSAFEKRMMTFTDVKYRLIPVS